MAIIEAQVDLFASPDLVPVDEDEHHGFTDRDRKFTIEVHQAVRSGSTTKDNSGGSEIKKVDEDVGGLNQPDKKPSESYQIIKNEEIKILIEEERGPEEEAKSCSSGSESYTANNEDPVPNPLDSLDESMRYRLELRNQLYDKFMDVIDTRH